MDSFLQLARDRYSCRKFSDKPVEKEKLDQIIEAALISPTAVNYQPEHLFILHGDDAQKKISEATRYTFGAKTFIVLGIQDTIAWNRATDGKYFGDVDAGIVGASILFAVKDLGLDSTFVGYFDPEVMKKNFPAMEDYDLIGIFPIGYAHSDSKPYPQHFKKNPIDSMVTEL